MIAPLHRFTEALQMPELTLRRLADCEPLLRIDGRPALQCTSYTTEAEVRMEGKYYLVAMPLNEAAARHLETTLNKIMRLHHTALTRVELLPEELGWRDSSGTPHRCDLWLQPLEGLPLNEGFNTLPDDEQLRAIDRLERNLERIGVAHNNLKEENLRWTGEELVAIRPWHAVAGGDKERDKDFFATWRNHFTPTATTLSDCNEAYEATNNYRWEGHEFEGLIAIETDEGFGFTNTRGDVVIEPRYTWVGDFREGRAVVKLGEKMGVIDRTGGYILEAQYEVIEYRETESRFWVRLNDLWAEFDYNGRQVSEFSDDYEI